MTTTAKHLLSEIVAGLDGVTPFLVLRCDVTGNPVGTDTVMIGHQCDCQGCRAHQRIERLEKALERLASTEAFTVPFFRRDNPEGRELLARFEFARAVLEAQPHSETRQEQR